MKYGINQCSVSNWTRNVHDLSAHSMFHSFLQQSIIIKLWLKHEQHWSKWLRLALTVRPNCVTASLPFHLRTGTDPVPEMCCFLNIRQCTKYRNLVILNVVYCCQNCLELTCVMSIDQVGTHVIDKLMAGCPVIKNSSFCQNQHSKYLLTFSLPKTDPVSEMCSFLNIIWWIVMAHQHCYVTSMNYGAKTRL